MSEYKVSLSQIIDVLHLTLIYAPKPTEELFVCSAEVNRPAIVLEGFDMHFDKNRIQACGMVEMSFLETLDKQGRYEALEHLFRLEPVAVVVTRGLEIPAAMREFAEKYCVPLLSSGEKTSIFMSQVISYLAVELAPRIFRHGVFVEVYGEGVLLLGESGVGKSETALELIKRGHRLIADDSVELRRVSDRSIVGSAPENIRHFIEIRGIGILNIRRLFGMGAVKVTEKVALVIELEHWNPEKNYSVLEPESEKISILGVELPKLTVPVRPGRNLAIIVEAAAMNNRQIMMGYNPVEELMDNIKKSIQDEHYVL